MVVCVVDPEQAFDVLLAEAILLLDNLNFAWTEQARFSKHASGLITHVVSRAWPLAWPASWRNFQSVRLSVSLTERPEQS